MKRKNQAVELDLFAASDYMEAQPNETKASSSDAMGKDEEAKSVISSDIASLFLRLSQSKFRSSFYLNQKDRDIIAAKGLATIREHARQIIAKRFLTSSLWLRHHMAHNENQRVTLFFWVALGGASKKMCTFAPCLYAKKRTDQAQQVS